MNRENRVKRNSRKEGAGMKGDKKGIRGIKSGGGKENSGDEKRENSGGED